MHEIPLCGLDGGNLLAFLAALGTLRVLTGADTHPEVRLRWLEEYGCWRPVIHHSRLASPDDITGTLAARVCGVINAAWTIGDDLNLKCEDFRNRLVDCLGRTMARDREEADFLAAFGSEFHGSGPKKDQMSDTEFRTMSGAGHQHFLGFMKELAIGTAAQHIARALFSEWDYADGRPSMRWDPADYRPHALRAIDPSTDPIRTMKGANLLAVQALPLFATAPEASGVRTCGFDYRKRTTEFTWPIWTDALDANVVRSLLALDDLQQEAPDRNSLRRRHISQVFRVERFTEGKYRNFSPARAMT